MEIVWYKKLGEISQKINWVQTYFCHHIDNMDYVSFDIRYKVTGSTW